MNTTPTLLALSLAVGIGTLPQPGLAIDYSKYTPRNEVLGAPQPPSDDIEACEIEWDEVEEECLRTIYYCDETYFFEVVFRAPEGSSGGESDDAHVTCLERQYVECAARPSDCKPLISHYPPE